MGSLCPGSILSSKRRNRENGDTIAPCASADGPEVKGIELPNSDKAAIEPRSRLVSKAQVLIAAQVGTYTNCARELVPVKDPVQTRTSSSGFALILWIDRSAP
jgi:hypothetical protein